VTWIHRYWLQVLVFNCDEEFDVGAMGRIFVGLLRCGAWGCFDEFNRLGEDVLSAVSQQVQAIQVRQTPSPAFPPHVCTTSALLSPLEHPCGHLAQHCIFQKHWMT
jgi:hypothetical protein